MLTERLRRVSNVSIISVFRNCISHERLLPKVNVDVCPAVLRCFAEHPRDYRRACTNRFTELTRNNLTSTITAEGPEEGLMLKIVTVATVALLAGTFIASYGAAPVSGPAPTASFSEGPDQLLYRDAHINAHLESLPVHTVEDYSLIYPVVSNQN
jgi:hypothetical protein